MKPVTNVMFLQAVKRYVRDIDPQADVWLFGSQARGDAHEHSDWDILVLTDKPVDRALKYGIWDHLNELEIEAEQTLGVLVHHKKEWEDLVLTDLYQNIKDDGQLL